MILLDCGNSRIKAQLRDGETLLGSYASTYDEGWTDRLVHWFGSQSAKRLAYCSVLDPARQAQLQQVLDDYFGDAVMRYESTAEALDVRSGYANPAQLGDDRWMALLAAAELVRGDAIVIDAGSAITLDLLRADGQHLGGAILPGFETSPETFRRIFAGIDFEHPDIACVERPGGSTEAAIQLDYEHSSLERLPELVNRWRQAYLPDAALILTGGDAERVRRLLDLPARLVPDLVFLGLDRMARA